MGGSLQDQLLESGLVTEDQLREARERPRPAAPKTRGSGGKRRGRGRAGKGGGRDPGAPRSGAAPRRAGAKAATEDDRDRAQRRQVHDMIARSAEARDTGETPYHFVKGTRVKRIYVTDDQRTRLADGALAVAAMKGKHYVIPMAVARSIHALIPGYFVAMGAAHVVQGEGAEVDDEYAEFKVPDDLTW